MFRNLWYTSFKYAYSYWISKLRKIFNMIKWTITNNYYLTNQRRAYTRLRWVDRIIDLPIPVPLPVPRLRRGQKSGGVRSQAAAWLRLGASRHAVEGAKLYITEESIIVLNLL
uniref:Uncharacterized protein n=1 Tax=Diaporthe sp. TaxID=1756133 RepID=A0A8K1ZR94_9PEZI|nr:hypothetical protein [Diaporthe sp.]